MVHSEGQPSSGALEAVRLLAGPSAEIAKITRLEGGQHTDTWRVETERPAASAVVRQFPPADTDAANEQRVLQALGGLGGLVPTYLGGDLSSEWSAHPTSILSCLEGHADITPVDPRGWARALGRALATVHAVPAARLAGLRSVFEHGAISAREALAGPLAADVRSRWGEIAEAPEALTHSDYWSGNVLWRARRLTGIVDWSGGARGPRGYDLGWCRLDLVLLYDEQLADDFLEAYEAAAGTVGSIVLWDSWALARSHDGVETWGPNYAPLGRPDLDERELRRRHSQWTRRLRGRSGREGGGHSPLR